jgi:hypothetical protein|nr:MAG TPA: protein of unknown function (DUF4376) [Bacteriophage sp.]
MQTKYKYKDKTYTHTYPLSEALGKEGIFIQLSISEEALKDLGVEVAHEEEPIEYLKERKIETLKMQRDKAEVEPITYQGYSFDYDEKARERINAAIIALEVAGASVTLTWTTADNKDVKVTASDLRGIIAQVALRSDKLHSAYRRAKEKVATASTKEEVEAITLV